MALMVLRTCSEIEGGLPSTLKMKMMFNIVLDFAVGLVPILGDVADAVFRANTRNAALLEAHLREKGKKNLRASGAPVPTVDPSDPNEYDRIEAMDDSGVISSQPSSRDEMEPRRSAKSANKNSKRSKREQSGSSSTTRNELRDMEEGAVSCKPNSVSGKLVTGVSRTGKSSSR